jgi:hypothetical protein
MKRWNVGQNTQLDASQYAIFHGSSIPVRIGKSFFSSSKAVRPANASDGISRHILAHRSRPPTTNPSEGDITRTHPCRQRFMTEIPTITLELPDRFCDNEM